MICRNPKFPPYFWFIQFTTFFWTPNFCCLNSNLAVPITFTICWYFRVTVHIKLRIYLFLTLTLFDCTCNIYYHLFHVAILYFVDHYLFQPPYFITLALPHDLLHMLIFHAASHFPITLTNFTTFCTLFATCVPFF